MAKIINESDEIKDQMPEGKVKLGNLQKSISQMEEELIKHDKPELKNKIKQLENSLKRCNHEINSFQDKRKVAQKNL